MDEWNLGNYQEVNTEKDLHEEQYSHERLCLTSPIKKKQYSHHGQRSSQTKFSYETNIDGLPLTNLKGKCRGVSAPKKLYYVSPPKKSSVENMLFVTTSRNCRLNTETPEKEDCYGVMSKSRALRNEERIRKNSMDKSTVANRVHEDRKSIGSPNNSNPNKDTKNDPNPNKGNSMSDSNPNKDTSSNSNPNKDTRSDPNPKKDESMSNSNPNKDTRSDSIRKKRYQE